MTSKGANISNDEEIASLVANQAAFYLLDICKAIVSHLGPRVNQIHRECTADKKAPRFDDINHAAAATKATFDILLTAFMSVIKSESIDQIISVSNSSPEATRDSVISWITLLEPLISASHSSAYPRLSVAEVTSAFLNLRPALVTDAFWAPDRAVKADPSVRKAVDRLYAMALEKSFVARGYDSTSVHAWLEEAYGVAWDAMRKWTVSARKVLGEEQTSFIQKQMMHSVIFSRRKNSEGCQEFDRMSITLAGAFYRRRSGSSFLPGLYGRSEIEAFLAQSGASRSRRPSGTAVPHDQPVDDKFEHTARLERLSKEIREAVSFVRE